MQEDKVSMFIGNSDRKQENQGQASCPTGGEWFSQPQGAHSGACAVTRVLRHKKPTSPEGEKGHTQHNCPKYMKTRMRRRISTNMVMMMISG